MVKYQIWSKSKRSWAKTFHCNSHVSGTQWGLCCGSEMSLQSPFTREKNPQLSQWGCTSFVFILVKITLQKYLFFSITLQKYTLQKYAAVCNPHLHLRKFHNYHKMRMYFIWIYSRTNHLAKILFFSQNIHCRLKSPFTREKIPQLS